MTTTETPTGQATPSPPRPWYRKKRFLIPLALIALFVVAGALGDGQEPANQTAEGPVAAAPAQPAPQPEPAAAVGVGQRTRDGKFEFVVQKLECGVSSVGNQFLSERAQGQFCLLTVRVSNIGSEPQFLFTDNQYLLDAEGRKFAPDSEATLYHNQDNDVWISEINPGNAVEGVIVFDLPAGAQPTQAQLHDSAFSGGVEVELS